MSSEQPSGGHGSRDQNEGLPPMRSQSALNLPPVEPWPEPVDGQMLLTALAELVRRVVVLSPWAADILALWIVHTYAYELRRVSSYIGIESPLPRCGKTTLMTLLSQLVNRPEPAANISSPAFYQAIEELRPTLLIDEADTLLPGKTELRGILNSGYTREMAYVLRLTNAPLLDPETGMPITKGRSRLARYSCYGPKAIAQIGHLPRTLADRCLVLRLERKLPEEECLSFQDLDEELLARLRRQCARFVQDHAHSIRQARPPMPKDLNDRAGQISEPLIVLADLAGGEWPDRARQAVVGLTVYAEQENPVGALLLDLFYWFTMSGLDRLFTRMLVEGLNQMPNRPWGGMRNGKGITDGWLAKQLEPFAVRPRMMRIGEVQARGYFQEDLAEIFRRYIPRAQMDALRAELEARMKPPTQVPEEPPANSNETPPSGSGPGPNEVRPEDESEPGAAAA